jgi:tripartite-type tricarboxylate transporter receptor subunit TctC
MLRRTFGAGAAWLLLARGAAAQAGDYPNNTIKIIVPFAAGSATDNGARNIADKLSKAWKVGVVVDNRPGANSFIGAQAAQQSKPDGHTIFVTSNTAMASNVALFKSLPYDPVEGFEPISLIGYAPVFLLAHPSLKANTLQELIALAKSQPGKLNWGAGSASTRIAGEMLRAKAGIDVTYVPYRSTPLALQDLMSGHLNMSFGDPVTSTPQIKAGTVKCLGVTNNGRYPLTPDIPTMIEQGLAGYELSSWTAVFVPKGIPRPIYEKLRAEIVKAISDPDYVETQARNGAVVKPTTPDEMRKIQLEEIRIYREIMKTAGIEPE